MTRTRFANIGLAIALLASNAVWAVRTLDGGITRTYLDAGQEATSELLAQTLAVLRVVAVSGGATRAEVVEAARSRAPTAVPYEKEGRVWIGDLGLKFDWHGRLVDAVTEPQSGEK